MKRKTITLVVYMLVCLSLVSVGFAAWIITGGSKTEATGNVTATTVSDHSVTISNQKWNNVAQYNEDDEVVSYGNIAFGHKTGAESTSGWLQYDSGYQEDLTDIYSFKISSGVNLDDAVDKLVTTTIEIDESNIQDLIDDKLIAKASLSFFVSLDEATLYNSNTQYKPYEDNVNSNGKSADQFFKSEILGVASGKKECFIGIKITYAFGDVFGSKNPYDFYNEMDNDVYKRKPNDVDATSGLTWKAHAQNNLSALYEGLYNGDALKNPNNAFKLTVKLLGAGEE